MFSLPEAPAPPAPRETYPFTLDEDVITTGESLKTAEKLTKTQLSAESVKNSGMDMLYEYDNNKRVWERNMPFGNTWDTFPRAPEPTAWARADEPKVTSPPPDTKLNPAVDPPRVWESLSWFKTRVNYVI